MNKDEIKTTIESIFKHMDCAISSCEFSDEDGILWCMIATPDSRFIIGRDGETLRSFNHLVRKMIEKSSSEEETAKVFIDVNGYQKKRFDNLKATAHMMAERARYFKSNIETDPMPAYERRIIHLHLEGVNDIKTESEGQGPNRRVIIKYIG
jgi:spoIIIJ-associated protein